MLLKISHALLAFLLLMAPALGQNADPMKLPDTLAGQRVAAYIKAFNSGDEQLMRAFLAENVSPHGLQRRSMDERLEIYKEMRGNMETMELRRVLEASDGAITVLIQTKKGEWFEIGFQFEAESPHKLLGLRVEDREAPPAGAQVSIEAPATPLTEAEAMALVEKQLNALVAADEFSGAVIIAKATDPFYRRPTDWRALSTMSRTLLTRSSTSARSTKSLRRSPSASSLNRGNSLSTTLWASICLITPTAWPQRR